jgi:hypothetical protein
MSQGNCPWETGVERLWNLDKTGKVKTGSQTRVIPHRNGSACCRELQTMQFWIVRHKSNTYTADRN